MTATIAVAVAGAAGAATRYSIDRAITSSAHGIMPWGTLAVNLLGSFALGLLIVAAPRLGLPAMLSTAIGAGFLGAFTTFSTWMYETVRLIEERAWSHAAANGIAPLIAGPAAAIVGAGLASAML